MGDTGPQDITRGAPCRRVLAGFPRGWHALPPMRSPRPSPASAEDLHARLSARIAALEDRVRRLEARLLLEARKPPPVRSRPSVSAATVRAARPRPRCPGCTLELPRGRRGESCVWCGFVFAAVARRPRRANAKSRKAR